MESTEGSARSLSLSYDIVKAHGGEMKVETKNNGGLPGEETGACFTITIPVTMKE